MDFIFNIKKGTKIYTIENCKIEEYYVDGIIINQSSKNIIDCNISNDIILNLQRYNDNVNSFETQKKLSLCFLSKEDLLKQL